MLFRVVFPIVHSSSVGHLRWRQFLPSATFQGEHTARTVPTCFICGKADGTAQAICYSNGQAYCGPIEGRQCTEETGGTWAKSDIPDGRRYLQEYAGSESAQTSGPLYLYVPASCSARRSCPAHQSICRFFTYADTHFILTDEYSEGRFDPAPKRPHTLSCAESAAMYRRRGQRAWWT